MSECLHAGRKEGPCPDCGACEHEVILNGACYYCGETELRVTVKPVGEPVVPVDRLRRRKS